MIIAAGLPNYLWAEAIAYHCWLRNRLHHSALANEKTTPHEKATQKKPDMSNLHEFGCTVWVKQLGRGKLQPQADPGRFVGVDEESKGVRVYWPHLESPPWTTKMPQKTHRHHYRRYQPHHQAQILHHTSEKSKLRTSLMKTTPQPDPNEARASQRVSTTSTECPRLPALPPASLKMMGPLNRAEWTTKQARKSGSPT